MPDTYVKSLDGVDFVLLGSDGIFEKYTKEEIGDFIYANLERKDPQTILREFISKNIAKQDPESLQGKPID